ncbi:MAG: hypothetical protein AB7K04_02680 [Pseudorhodoplanes sp.]
MSLGLYVFGALLAAAGVMMIGFGIPINEFSLGNTLILAGSTALAGGLVVVGLGATVGRLDRIAEALARPAARPASRAAVETGEPALPPAREARVPFPPKPASRDQRAESPRAAASEIEPPEEAVIERPRPAFTPVFRSGEPPIVEDSDDVTLSPRPPFRPAGPRGDAPDFAGEKAWPSASSPDRLRRGEPSEQGRQASAETIARSGTASSRQPGLFESVWSSSRKRAAAEPAEAHERPAHEPSRTETGDEPPMPVSILKSGIVDGMAYTLYTDGSIEAELAEGVVRFASIEELRTHLERGD